MLISINHVLQQFIQNDADAEDDKRAGGGEGDKQLPALDVGAAAGNQTQVKAQNTGLG